MLLIHKFYFLIQLSSEVDPTTVNLTLPAPIPDEGKKLIEIFIFTLLCGGTKGFMKVLKAFIKPFEAPQRSVKIKTSVNFYFTTTF